MSDLMPKEWILGKASDFVVSPKMTLLMALWVEPKSI